MKLDIAVLKQRLEWSHLTFSMSSKMAFRLDTLILALIVHNASPTPSRKFIELNVENVRWDDMPKLLCPTAGCPTGNRTEGSTGLH